MNTEHYEKKPKWLPLEMCFTNDVVPLETPLTKAPGPRVSPSYGSLKKSAMPFPTLRTRLAGLPRISRDPTTQPGRDQREGVTETSNTAISTFGKSDPFSLQSIFHTGIENVIRSSGAESGK